MHNTPNGVFLLVCLTLLLSHETCSNVTPPPVCFIQDVLHIKCVTVVYCGMCVHVTCYGSSVFTGS